MIPAGGGGGPASSRTVSASSVAVGDFDDCPAAGTGGDPDLNTQKNRSDAAVNPQPITVQYLKGLPTVPSAQGKTRSGWAQQYQTQVANYEERPVVLTVYIVKAKGEGKESCNCNSADAQDHDVHVYVTDDADGSVEDSAIVEVTPRWRAANPTWTWQNLEKVAEDGDQVRVTGWMLYDQEHWNMINANPPQRGTLWEIHPITAIQVETRQGWVDLAQATP